MDLRVSSQARAASARASTEKAVALLATIALSTTIARRPTRMALQHVGGIVGAQPFDNWIAERRAPDRGADDGCVPTLMMAVVRMRAKMIVAASRSSTLSRFCRRERPMPFAASRTPASTLSSPAIVLTIIGSSA